MKFSTQELAHFNRLFASYKFFSQDQRLGNYRSIHRGQGMEFEEVREYSLGDDVRSIDWNVTARSSRPFVKIYREEKERTVMIALDVSGSMFFGKIQEQKQEVASQLAWILGQAAFSNKDNLGFCAFSQEIETFIPPKKGPRFWNQLSSSLKVTPKFTQTNFELLFDFLQKRQVRRSLLFLISDFFSFSAFPTLSSLAQKNHVVALALTSPLEQIFPNVGFCRLRDLETQKEILVPSHKEKWRKSYEKNFLKLREEQKHICQRFKIPFWEIQVSSPLLPQLRSCFLAKS